jgi:SAM-dependent methyltransferase
MKSVRRAVYKTVYGKLLERFVAAEKRIAALEKAAAQTKKKLGKFGSGSASPVAGSEPDAALVTQLAQLQTLLELRGVLPAIPPGHLQFRVAGHYSPTFFRQGVDLLRGIEAVMAPQGRTIESFSSILDFGCGCGRILIPLMLRVDPSRLYGCDIDPEAIAWCKANLPSCAGFGLNPSLPPMPFADQQFDFSYGVSVFTHLPEDMQHLWLDELYRVTKPGGYAVMTFHGEPHYAALHPQGRERLEKHGFFYSGAPHGSTEGLPDFYQTSWHTHDYVRKHWGKKFEVCAIVEGAIANHGAAVMRRNA